MQNYSRKDWKLKKGREREKPKKSREREERQKEREAVDRRQEREIELEKLKLEAGIKRTGVRTAGGGQDNTEEDLNDKESGRVKEMDNFRKILRALVPKVPSDPGELPWFFQVVEGVFRSQSIPKELQGHLVSPLLEEKMQPLLVSLSEDQLKDYELVRDEVLRLNKLTSTEYRKRFDEARKLRKETWPQYVQRINSYWHFYISSKKVDDLNKLNNLIVLDRLKREFPEETRSYVNLREADDAMSPEKAANMAEIFEAATEKSIQTSKYGDMGGFDRKSGYSKIDSTKHQDRKNFKEPYTKRDPQNVEGKNKGEFICYNCGTHGHLARHCVKPKKSQVKVQAVEVKAQTEPIKSHSAVTARVHGELFKVKGAAETNAARLSALKMIKVRYRGKTLDAVVDSGTQISVFREGVLDDLDKNSRGRICLQPAFGKSREADLVEINLSLAEGTQSGISPVILAVVASCDDLNVDALLDTETYEALIHQRFEYTGFHVINNQAQELNVAENDQNVFVAANNAEMNEAPRTERSLFLKDQESCQTLTEAWNQAKRGKGDYEVLDKVLYHKGRIASEKVFQLVLPLIRRKEVLELAHTSVAGAHMGQKKTGDRIKLTFWWPKMNEDIIQFCSACKECQLKARELVVDRVPISPITRPELPFMMVNIDIIGPISPVSAKGNAYILTLVDYCTRWAEAIPLRSITAKNTCNALLNIFMRLGIPNIIASDQGTNFTSDLTKEFYSKLGISPRFSTPGHPESNGLVERWNGVLKNMLHHVIREDPRHWDTQIPFLLWAYREVPHSTTGVSPFVLMYGRDPIGPLSILKDMWLEEKPLPLYKGKSINDYLGELKARMAEAARIARITAEYQQELMCHNYNTRSKVKNFDIGDEVVVLIPDSTNKLYARWKGPAKILKKERPYTYIVQFEDETMKRIHANKLRPFRVFTNMVGVVFDSDSEFGDIEYAPVSKDEANQEVISMLNADCLSVERQQELEQILSRYKEIFTGNLKRALVGEHHIRTIDNREYHRPHIYRIPESMKPKVEAQIEELLQEGLIESCTSQYAHPIVCVSKKNGEMRLCIDYRALNLVTEVDAFPMENVKELMMSVAKANFISLLDLRKGYWQLPLAETSKLKSAFITHQGQYAWNVMPFGLKGASATFQRAMNEALYNHRTYARAYIDDIAVFSYTWEEHLQHLQNVLQTLEALRLSVNLEKCEFGRPKIRYLGHVIGSGQHQPDPDKLLVIKTMTRPSTKKELRRVLGLFNYYRDYIKNFSSLAYPLTEMTKKNSPSIIHWKPVETEAFETLKEKLCQATTCYVPKLTMPFIIYTDASQVGIGAVLAQKEDEMIRPVAFASAKFNTTQQSWSVAEQEAYAVVWALKKFEVWTFGSKIEIVTDNNPLKFLTTISSPSPKLQRWALALQRYDLTITHRKGSEHINADTLSRLP